MASSVNFIRVREFEIVSVSVNLQLLERSPRDIVVSHRGLSLTDHDIRLLIERKKGINDQIINLYMKLIQERNVRKHLQPVYVFDAHFYTSLVRSGVENSTVKTSTIKPLFDHKLALMPCHLETENHWVLIGINFIEKTIHLYDSISKKDTADLRLIREFLLSHIDKLGLTEKFPDFDMCIAEFIPRQDNLYDCGVYTMVYAEFLSRNVHPVNIKHDAQFYRKKIHSELIRKKIIARK